VKSFLRVGNRVDAHTLSWPAGDVRRTQRTAFYSEIGRPSIDLELMLRMPPRHQ